MDKGKLIMKVGDIEYTGVTMRHNSYNDLAFVIIGSTAKKGDEELSSHPLSTVRIYLVPGKDQYEGVFFAVAGKNHKAHILHNCAIEASKIFGLYDYVNEE